MEYLANNQKLKKKTKNKKEKCFSYPFSAALHHHDIPDHLERSSNLNYFADQYS